MKSGDAKPRASRLKALVVLGIIIVAAVAGAYYYISTPHAPPQFLMTANPPFFHAAAGGWGQVLVEVSRMPGFTGGVNVSLTNAPAWISANPIIINSTSINGTLTFHLSNQAQLGAYSLTITGTVATGLAQTAPISLKVVGIKQVASQYGSGVVYDTTKSLDPETLAALVSYANGTLQFSKSTTQLNGLEQGDVIVAPPNSTSVVPKGFLLTVLDTSNSGATVFVDTRLAALTEVFQELHFGHTPPNGTSTSGTYSAPSFNPTPNDDVTNLCASQITCVQLFNKKIEPTGFPADLGGGTTLDAYLEASAYAYAYGDISCCVNVDFGLLFLGHEEAYMGIKGSKGAQLNYHNNDIDTIASADIQIIPGLLWIDINLNLAGQASGILKEDVNANIDQFFNVIVGPTYNGGLPSALQSLCNTSTNGWDFCHYHDFQPPTPTFTVGLPTTTGDGPQSNPTWPLVEIGPSLSADVDGVVGLSFEIFVYALLNTGTGMGSSPASEANWPCEPTYCPIWIVYFGIGASIDFWINLQVWQAWYKITWPRLFQWEIAYAPQYPPSTPILYFYTDLGPGFDLTTSSKPYVDAKAFLPQYGATYSCNSSGTSCTESPGVPSYTADPQGENVTCIWMTKEIGEIGQTPAHNDEDSSLPGDLCGLPPLTAWPTAKIASLIENSITKLTVTVIAENTGGEQSPPSNPVTIPVILPTPTLDIIPITQPIFQNNPFNAQGSATITSPLLQSFTGLINLCQTEPQNIEWFVGGRFEADIVDTGEGGWVGAQSYGYGCNPALTAKAPGQVTVSMVMISTDPQTGNTYIPETANGNPLYIATTTINVQPAPTQPQPGGLSIQILTPSEPSTSPPHTPTVNPTVQLQGSLTGGTAPYTVTWEGSWDGKSAAIAKGLKYNTLDYTWQVCTNGYPWFGFSGVIYVTLSVVDANGLTAQATTPPEISINFNCAVIQVITSPPFAAGLASLLVVLFVLTGERIAVKVRTHPSDYASCVTYTCH